MAAKIGCLSDPNDEACLTNLNKSLQDPNKSLHNWNQQTFAKPCNDSTSNLQGAICNNGRIYKLSLNNLSLRGTISPFLSNCTNLQALDLSSNFLTGPIPPDLQSLVNLAVLNLSSNRLEAIRSFESVIGFRWNKDLYGYPLPPLRSKGLSILAIVGIGLGSGLASLVLSFTGVCIWLKVTDRKVALEEGKISHLMPDY
ncbi:hypothetical protein P8452_45794 [Trifolium repens]|nr:hypothetical protein P8452_45794 [Trifolium repens]